MVLSLIIAWYATLTAMTLAAFALDKRAAGRGGWRIRERTLLTLAAAGGFAGAIAGMSFFRHKSRKWLFRIVPWLAAVVHVAAWILIRRG